MFVVIETIYDDYLFTDESKKKERVLFDISCDDIESYFFSLFKVGFLIEDKFSRTLPYCPYTPSFFFTDVYKRILRNIENIRMDYHKDNVMFIKRECCREFFNNETCGHCIFCPINNLKTRLEQEMARKLIKKDISCEMIIDNIACKLNIAFERAEKKFKQYCFLKTI